MDNISSYGLYFTVIIVASIFAHMGQYNTSKSSKIKKKWIVLSFSLTWLVAGLRYNVGSDYFNYIRIYDEIGRLGIGWALTSLRTEPLYAILNWLIYTFIGKPEYVFIITSFLVLFLIYSAIIKHKKTLNIGFSLFIFLCVYYFPMFTFIRLAIAVGIVLHSYKHLTDRNFFKFLILIFVAAGFHYTAIIVLPMYFVTSANKKHFRLKFIFFLLWMIGLTSLFQFVAEGIFEGVKYERYIVDLGNFKSGFNQILLRAPIIAFVGFFRKRLVSVNPESKINLQIYFFGVSLLPLTFWLGIFDRMLIYFFISQILIVPQIFKVIKKNEVPLFLYGITLYYLLRVLYYFQTNHRMFPYDMTWPF